MQHNTKEIWHAFQALASAHPHCNAVKLVSDLQRWFVEAQQLQIIGSIALTLAQRSR